MVTSKHKKYKKTDDKLSIRQRRLSRSQKEAYKTTITAELKLEKVEQGKIRGKSLFYVDVAWSPRNYICSLTSSQYAMVV